MVAMCFVLKIVLIIYSYLPKNNTYVYIPMLININYLFYLKLFHVKYWRCKHHISSYYHITIIPCLYTSIYLTLFTLLYRAKA